ncbi:MAG: hypothetical protein LC732_07380, partial [Acidobacteria bacterium]|nr:hypothetical protein [Acidobacteriota bacterium]
MNESARLFVESVMKEKAPERLLVTSRTAVQALALLLLLPAVLFGGSYLPTTDEDLVARADLIGTFTVVASNSYYGADGLIYTTHRLDPEESIKCSRGSFPLPRVPSTTTCTKPLYVTELGGVVGDRLFSVSTTPSYAPGERVLAFLSARNGGWTTLDGQLGKYTFARDPSGREILARDHVATAFSRGLVQAEKDAPNVTPTAHQAESPRIRDAAEMLTRIRALVRAEAPLPTTGLLSLAPPLFVQPNSLFPGNAFLTQFSFTNPGGARWPGLGFSMLHQGSAGSAGAATVFNLARETWNADPQSNINIVNSGTTGAGLSGNTLTEVSAHELGHCLGFRHSNEGEPNSTNALMNSTVTGVGPFLRDWDREAANAVYGDGTVGSTPPCVPPSIVTQPQSTLIFTGQTATLSVAAAGDAPFEYQWFVGGSPSTGSALQGATGASFTTPPLTEPRTYSVLVTSSCGSIESAVATVTPVACSTPSITTQPRDRTIFAGQTATVSVIATTVGPMSYQWYQGFSGDTSNPVPGGTGQVLTTPPLSGIARYWVRVTNT